MPKPLFGLVAATELARQARAAVERHALRARGAGYSWRELAGLLRVETSVDAYELILGPEPAGSYRHDRYLYWTCSRCQGRVRDNGPYDAHPSNCEEGHAPDCIRHGAEVAVYLADLDDDE